MTQFHPARLQLPVDLETTSKPYRRFNERVLRHIHDFLSAAALFLIPILRPKARFSPLKAAQIMNLDVNTLFLVTVYVEAILGLLLLFAWAQNTQVHAVAWWGFAH